MKKYGSALKSLLAGLDLILAKALRICTEAVRSSPICALQVETGELPLLMCRKQLLTNYWVNLKGQDDSHPTKRVIQACWERGAVHASSFGWTGELVAKEMGLDDKTFCLMAIMDTRDS